MYITGRSACLTLVLKFSRLALALSPPLTKGSSSLLGDFSSTRTEVGVFPVPENVGRIFLTFESDWESTGSSPLNNGWKLLDIVLELSFGDSSVLVEVSGLMWIGDR